MSHPEKTLRELARERAHNETDTCTYPLGLDHSLACDGRFAALLEFGQAVLDEATGNCPGCGMSRETCLDWCAIGKCGCCADCKHIDLAALKKQLRGES